MTVTVYSSDDASAPTLRAVAGNMIGVLDACLVTGYGSKTAAGWTKSYAGTNQAVYRQGAGNQLYLRVVDVGTTTARVAGMETWSGTILGTGLFPSEQQFASGLHVTKAAAVDANNRSWMVVATAKAFYMWVNYSNESGSPLAPTLMFFGDIQSYKANDQYHTMLSCGTSATVSTHVLSTLTSALTSTTPGHYIARPHTQIGSSIPVGKHSDNMRGTTMMGRGNLPFPNPTDGTSVMAPVWVHENNTATYPIRGVMPGMWNICHLVPYNHGDVIVGAGAMAGKTFKVFNLYGTAGNPAQCAIEISNTW